MKHSLRRIFACALATIAGALAVLQPGCSTADRFNDPSRTGYDEHNAAGSAGALSLPPLAGMPLLEGPFDEVWVISRNHASGAGASVGTTSAVSSHSTVVPGTGSLLALDDSARHSNAAPSIEQAHRAFPLERTTVRADLAGPVATVSVAQRFRNPFPEKIEAVYVFPLPHDAAVNDFVLTVGERRIRGVIRDREEAQAIYVQARGAGLVASLLEQERANIFQERVANIEPGKTIEVTLQFVNALSYERDAWEWRFPMVVAPRFNPPYGADRLPALPVGAVAASGGMASIPGTPIEYLRDGERSGADIDLEVRLDAGAPIRTLECSTHAIDVVERGDRTASLRLAARDRIPNRDFVLRYGTAGSTPSHAFVTDGAPRDGALLLSIIPPAGALSTTRVPLEVVLIVDTSGSMTGRPFEQAMEAANAALGRLGPDDRFQIVTFSNSGQSWRPGMVRADAATVAEARRWLAGLSAGGGTMMLEGLRTALALPHDAERVRTLVFITDALLSNEDEILRAIHDAAAKDRVFALGVGASVNWALLDAMARVGGGAVAALSLDERATPCMERFIERIGGPSIHSIRLTFEGGAVREVVPSRLPDLIPGSPITVAARFDGAPPTRATLTGWIGGQAICVPLDLAASSAANTGRNEGVQRIWARQRIAELSRESTWGDARACGSEIRRIALANNLVSPWTSFVAVDASAVTAGSGGTTVIQPARMPRGMRYDTTVAPAPPPGGWPQGPPIAEAQGAPGAHGAHGGHGDRGTSADAATR